MNFGQSLKKLREAEGLSQEDLAQKFNTTNQTVSRWELNQNEPDIKTLRKLAKFFDVTVDFLIGDED